MNKSLSIESRLVHLSLGIALTSVVLWFVLYAFGPKFIEQAYQGLSIPILNSLITGQRDHPVSEYISAFVDLIRSGLFSLLVFSGALYLLANAIKHQAHLRSVTHINVIVFAVLFALIVLRDPTLFTEPRFWAEEATVYFKVAYTDPTWTTLIAPHQGYLSLWANLAGFLATIPPLEYAPLVTTWMSLFVLMSILTAIIVNESDHLDTTLKKALAGVAVLVVGASGEIWLTSINSQHYLPLLVFLILIDSKRNAMKRRIGFGVVAIAGLSSVAVNFLTPLFLLRYRQRRERADLGLFFILASTSVIQLLAIAYSTFVLGDAAYYHPIQRRTLFDFDALSVLHRLIYYAFAYPLFGFSGLWSWFGAALLLGIGYLARGAIRPYWVFLGAVLLLTSLSVVSSMGMQGGPRYAYSSAVILTLLLLALTLDSRISGGGKIIAVILFTTSIAYWSTNYRSGMDGFRNPHWPSWANEVKAWRLDPTRKLQVHPVWESQTAIGLVWSLELRQKNR